jgi:predicted Fe-Mo cluster-binding NifX family protein
MPVMRIALPIWEQRVSPVFDVSEQVLLADVQDRQTLSRDIRPLTTVDSAHRAETLAAWGVELLICGAISQVLEQSLRARDIQVLSRIRGEVEDVLTGYISGRLDDPHFLMPGCQQKHMATAANPRMGSKGVHCCEGLEIDTQELDDAESGLASDGGPAGRRLWVARDGSAVVGELEIHEQDHVGRITRLDVDDSWQQGPASCCLLQQALSYCRQRGLIKVTLGASARTRRAVRLLRCFGFQPSRRRGRQRVLEFYLNLYRLIDEDRCASEVRQTRHGGAEA